MDNDYCLTGNMKKIILITLLTTLVSCMKADTANISQEKMIAILYDLTLASSARSTANKRDTLQYVVSYESILKKHGTDSLQFVNAQNEYRKNPEVFAAIYDSVNNRLQKELDKIRETKPEPDERIAPVNLKPVSFSLKKEE